MQMLNLPKFRDRDVAAAREFRGDRATRRIDRGVGRGTIEAGTRGHLLSELVFGQFAAPVQVDIAPHLSATPGTRERIPGTDGRDQLRPRGRCLGIVVAPATVMIGSVIGAADGGVGCSGTAP